MKTFKRTLGDFNELQILALADLHLGDKNANYKQIAEWIEYIKTHDNCYTILNGDLMDMATRHSIGDIFSSDIKPMHQLEQCVKLFDPIKEKILVVDPGNHEINRIWKNDGVDMTEIMCQQLGISDRYSPASSLLFLRFGKDPNHDRPLCYTIFSAHGSGGGGRLPGGKINRLVDMASIVDADIYIMSHVHQPAIVRNSFYRTNMGNSSVAKVDKLYINTAAALDWGGYGEHALFRPASLKTPLLILNGRKHQAEALL